jgi:hypothetical protein
MEPWTRTQDHEASHLVIAWNNAKNTAAIQGLDIWLDNSRRVVAANIDVSEECISIKNRAKVGLAGFLGEALGVIYRNNEKPQDVDTMDIAKQVINCDTLYLACGGVVDNNCWRISWKTTGTEEIIKVVFTVDDLLNVEPWLISVHNDKDKLSQLIKCTIDDIQEEKTWKAIIQVGALIPDTDRHQISTFELHQLLERAIPRNT